LAISTLNSLAFGGGLHVRKAFDHVFSFRAGALFASMKNENENDTRSSETTWLSGSAQVVMTVNNLRFNKPYRKVERKPVSVVSASLTSTPTAKNVVVVRDNGTVEQANEVELDGTNPMYEVGFGVAYRVSPKFNLGLEYTFGQTFGKDSDLLDGDANVPLDGVNQTGTSYRDAFHWPHLSLNFNLGGKDKARQQKI
jgi:OOP family OmpA-OmpF porin